MKRILLGLIAIALLVGASMLGWKFPGANADLVDIDLLWVRVPNVAVWQLMLVSIGLGAFGVGLLSIFLGARSWLLKRRYRKTIRQLEKEVHQLRSLPLTSSSDVSEAESVTSVGRS